MTEGEWLTGAKPWEMVAFVRTGGDRKLRLFACACCRQVMNPFVPPLAIRAVTAAEAFADGELSADALAAVREVISQLLQYAYAEDRFRGIGYLSRVFEGCTSVCTVSSTVSAAEMAQDVCHATACAAADVTVFRTDGGDRTPEYAAELAAQAEFLRDVFGNPFRAAPERDPARRTADVVGRAPGMYD
jgi:hypothetical protein